MRYSLSYKLPEMRGAFRGGDWSLRPLRDFSARWLRSIAPPNYKPSTIAWYKSDLDSGRENRRNEGLLRQGEILGLRWRNIDLARGRMEVRQAVVQIAQQKFEVAPKTRSSERVVAMPRSLVKALRRHLKDQIAEGFGGEDDRVITTEAGGIPDRAYLLRRVLRPALIRAKLPIISWRELRHTFASATIEMDVPREALQHTLGHTNLNVTLGIYDEAFCARQAIVADAWNVGFSGDKVSKGKKLGHTP